MSAVTENPEKSSLEAFMDTLPPFYRELYKMSRIIVQIKKVDPDASAELQEIKKSMEQQFNELENKLLRGLGDSINILNHRCGEGLPKIADSCGVCLTTIDHNPDKKRCEMFGCPGKYLCMFDGIIEDKSHRQCDKCEKKFCSRCAAYSAENTVEEPVESSAVRTTQTHTLCGECAGSLTRDPRDKIDPIEFAVKYRDDFREARTEWRASEGRYPTKDPSSKEITESYTAGRRLFDTYVYLKTANRRAIFDKK